MDTICIYIYIALRAAHIGGVVASSNYLAGFRNQLIGISESATSALQHRRSDSYTGQLCLVTKSTSEPRMAAIV